MKNENNHFDISRRDQLSFRHYQILVKLQEKDKTEQHTLEIFTTGAEQLLEMRRVYAKTYKTHSYRTVYKTIKNN